MKFIVTAMLMFTTSPAGAACGETLLTYAKKQLVTKGRVDTLVGHDVTILDQQGKREIRGLITAAELSRKGNRTFYFRLLDEASNDVRVLKYELLARDLNRVTLRGIPAEIAAARADSDRDEMDELGFLPYRSTEYTLENHFNLEKPVRLVMAAEGDVRRLETLNGLVTLAPRDERAHARIFQKPTPLTVETANGPVRVSESRVVAIFAHPIGF